MAVRTHTDIDWDAAILAVIVILRAAIASMQIDVDAIKAVTEAEGILEETGGTITSELGAEITVYRNNSPTGTFIPKCVKIATSNQTAAETITIKEYYRIESGGALLLHDSVTYAGVIAMEVITVHLDPNRFGVEVTLLLDAGETKDYLWEALYEV